ncbi:uncharacterized protein LOC125587214 [Brassica napus]|uniref:uncharacterized protein LOC125587214 n=1 Tax=Brassica napus TaxID=3708 RepID=UPI00207A0A95|nr:uncharacterized protein LOC125587214 [Brassica napus]
MEPDWHWSTHLNGHSFWTIAENASDSWAWRKLLDLRPLALQFSKTRLGNGLTASFWSDQWTPIVSQQASGPNRCYSRITLDPYTSTSSTTWEVLMSRQQIKNWVDVVWFKGAIPKHSFTMWIVNYDRLPTRSRLAAWGLPVSPSCPFYSNFEEMRDHLMLSCEYIQEVWREVLLRCQPPNTMFVDWSELLSWIRAASSSKLSLLRKLAVQTVIYHLWKQRNNLRYPGPTEVIHTSHVLSRVGSLYLAMPKF